MGKGAGKMFSPVGAPQIPQPAVPAAPPAPGMLNLTRPARPAGAAGMYRPGQPTGQGQNISY